MLGGHDVKRLMRSLYSADEQDEFGKEEDATKLLPLPLPSAMDGRPAASKSPFFTLPPEILGEIMNLLVDDRAALSAMALVNSDCRQLARCCQFASVCFDYHPRSNQLRSHLMREAHARQNHDTPGTIIRPPFIGSCIRRVTVRSDHDFVAHEHNDLYESIWGDTAMTVTSQERDELRKAATEYYFGTHYASILAAMSAMPNLETVSWYDRMCLDSNFFKCVTNLPLRHLKICKAYIGDPYCLDSLGPSAMSLETLYLDISACYDKVHADEELYEEESQDEDEDVDEEEEELDEDDELREDNGSFDGEELYEDDEMDWESKDLVPFMETLLERCSATLERLTLRCTDCSPYQSLTFGHEPVVFDQLQYLDLSGCFDDFDTVAWRSFLSAPLRHLALPGRISKSLIQSIHGCQPMRHLETLVLSSFGYVGATEAPPILDLISRHPHIRKLSVQSGEPQLMDRFLIPLLSSGRYTKLTSLSLGWRGPGLERETSPNIATISAKSLAAIGSIKSLEQLCLTAGDIYSDRHQWLIDHDMLRSNLRGLAKLKRLAFSRNTYHKPGASEAAVEGYYDHQFITSSDYVTAMQRPYLDRPPSILRTEEGSTDDDIEFHYSRFSDARIWECAHRNRMLREAERYLRALPSLEWIYCGQRPMGFRDAQTTEGRRRIAVPLTGRRESGSTLLGRMFAMGGDRGKDDNEDDF